MTAPRSSNRHEAPPRSRQRTERPTTPARPVRNARSDPMIAKVRVLGLRAADARALRAAGGRIRDYLEGGEPDNHRADGGRAGATDLADAPDAGGAQPDPGVSLGRLTRYYETGPG